MFCRHLSRLQSVSDMEKLDISFVYRRWFQEPAVRANMVDHGQLIVSHKGGHERVKITIKDCVRNMYVLQPLLEKIASSQNWKLFTVHAARAESPGFQKDPEPCAFHKPR